MLSDDDTMGCHTVLPDPRHVGGTWFWGTVCAGTRDKSPQKSYSSKFDWQGSNASHRIMLAFENSHAIVYMMRYWLQMRVYSEKLAADIFKNQTYGCLENR